MTPTTTHRITIAVAGTLAAAALLVPVAQARPDSWLPQPEQATSIPDVFERAVAASKRDFAVGSYRDAQHLQQRASGSALYSDTERALHLRVATPVSDGGSDGSSDGSFDWHLLATLSSIGALGAVLAAGTLLTRRQRTRLA